MNMLFSQRQFDCLLLMTCGYDRVTIAGILRLTYGQAAYACEEARRKLIRMCRSGLMYTTADSAPFASLLQEALKIPEIQRKLADPCPDGVLRLLHEEYLAIKRGER